MKKIMKLEKIKELKNLNKSFRIISQNWLINWNYCKRSLIVSNKTLIKIASHLKSSNLWSERLNMNK